MTRFSALVEQMQDTATSRDQSGRRPSADTHMTWLTGSRALKVLVVAEDRDLLRHLSRFLGAFGYQVQQAADRQLAALALEGKAPDLLIVDSDPALRSALDLCRLAGERDGRSYVYTFLLVNNPGPQELMDALEAGVDDFLAKPLVYGELLVRLRAGARALEFERRIREQDTFEPVCELPSRSAFYDRLRRALSGPEPQDRPGACVVVDLDFFDQLNFTHGRGVGNAVLRASAERLGALCGETDVLCCLGGGRFALWLPDLSEEAALEWAERARGELAETELTAAESALRVTASFGVAGCKGNAPTPDELVRRATSALKSAKSSGRNCVVRFGQFDAEAKTWEELAAPGKLFERTLARDVMSPCTLIVKSDQTVAEAAALFRRTRLQALPVVDERGKLAGLIAAEKIPASPSAGGSPSALVCDVMTYEVTSYEEDTSFSELVQFFKQDSGSLLVIVRGGWPTGFVTAGSLAALSEPLKTDSFPPDGPYSNNSGYLMVPDPCLVD